MKIEVTIKRGHKLRETTSLNPWSRGHIVEFVPLDTVNYGVQQYAIVQTEHGEFETVIISSLQAVTPSAPVSIAAEMEEA